MLDTSLMIKCPRCEAESTLGDWDDYSYAECITREMRRGYIPLQEKRAFNTKSGVCYKCPKCAQWIRGSQLIIDSDDPELRKLGRKRLTTVDGRRIIKHTK